MGGHYRKEFTDTVIHVQKQSVSVAVVTVRETRGSLNSQSMMIGYKAIIRRMIDRIREDEGNKYYLKTQIDTDSKGCN
jgi:hypothetical protein